MPDLTFAVESVQPVAFAAAPLLAFRLRVSNSNAAEPIHSVVLRAQIQIEVTRRHYDPAEQKKLRDLFGDPDRWSQTLRNLLWTHATVVVPPFTGSSTAELHVPCTFDFNVAATKYFHALSNGDIPLSFLFSGTVFYETADDALQVAPISWSKEARFRLPLEIWRQMMDEHYPNTAWICLRRDIFDQLLEYKTRHGIPTWEQTVAEILRAFEETVRA